MTNIVTLIKKVFAILLTIALVTSTNASYTSSVLAAPGINYQIGYQGFLKDSSGYIVTDGNYDMVFNIYNVSSGGTPLWTGTHTSANSNPIVVDDGFFHVLLGSGTGNAMTVDFSQDEYYIGITVGADSEMSPRHRIAAHPQAFNADLLDGLDSTAFVQSLGSPTGSSANGGSISSGFLTLSLADGTNPGLVSIDAQTFAGDKTFNGALTFNNSTVSIPNNLNFDSNTFFIGAGNNRVGIGNNSPSYLLDLSGSSSIAQRTIGMNGVALLYLPDQGTAANQFAGSLALGGGLRNLSNPGDAVSGRYNAALGIEALKDNTTGYANTASGYTTLISNTTGYSNSAHGDAALYYNTSGNANTADGNAALFFNTTGSKNTASGYTSLYYNTTGSFNLALGTNALYENRDGSNNIALGNNAGTYYSGGDNLTGDYNIFIGPYTRALADGDENEIVIGNNATGIGSDTITLGNNNVVTTALKGNVGIGSTAPSAKLHITPSTAAALHIDPYGTLAGNTGEIRFAELLAGGSEYTGFKAPDALAANVLYTLPNADGTSGQVLSTNSLGQLSWVDAGGSSQWTTSGSDIYYNTGNVGIGTTAPTFKLELAGTSSIADRTIGINTMPVVYLPQQGTGVGQFEGSLSVGNGLRLSSNTAGTEGRYNTAVGIGALKDNTTGYANTASGYGSLFFNTTGYSNSAHGTSALGVNTTGNANTADGNSALVNNTSGSNNTASGYISLNYNTTGNYNVALGSNALYQNTDGSHNIAIGYQSGMLYGGGTNNETGDYNIFIGPDTRALAANDQNEIVIGNGAFGIGSNTVTLGNDNVITTALKGNVGIGTTSPSAKLEVKASGTGVIAKFTSDNTTGCTLAGDGTISCSSDRTLKKNDQEITGALDDALLLRPVTFDWNYEEDGAGNNIGFIAQEVEEVLPGLVTTDENGLKFLKYDRFAPILVKAIQELNEKVDALGGSPIASSSSLLRMNEERFAKLEEQGVITSVENLVVHGEGIFEKLASFLGDAFFGGRVTFADHDMAGFATIKNSADRVHITFDREYEHKPVVQVTMDSTVKLDDIEFQVKTMVGECDKDADIEACEEFLGKKLTGDMLINHSVANVTEKGFDIILDTRAFQDLNFNWTAIQVKDAKRHESEKTEISLPKLELNLKEKNETSVSAETSTTPIPEETNNNEN